MTEIQTFMLSISFGFAVGHLAGDVFSLVLIVIDAIKSKKHSKR